MAHVSEDQVVQFSLGEVQSNKFRATRTLLGRLFTTDQFTMVELRDALRSAWQIKGLLKVSKTQHDLFEITMPNEEAKKWALNRSPWVIKDRLLTFALLDVIDYQGNL
ncbi:unnamed protein product [Linum trigynum]|uniref:DUF4283 domain-containing protein n=1 Tax=Linum trigynum TaxID=586398 RepID=A0AAV2EXZ0_9ROSI